MSLRRKIAFCALLLVSLAFVPQESSAWGGFGFSFGYAHHYPGYYGYHRPYYYPYYYRPFYGGFYSPFYYGGGYGYGYGYPGYYDYFGDIRTEVKPNEANVFVDGNFAGVADDFDGWWQRLEVVPGKHRLTFRLAGFAPYVVDVAVVPGQDVKIKYDMSPGVDQIADQDMRLPREEYERQYGDRDRYREGDQYRHEEPYRYDDRDRQYQRRPYDNRGPYNAPPPDNRGPYNPPPPDDRGPYNPPPDNRGPYNPPPDNYGSPDAQNTPTLFLSIEPPDATVYIDGNYYGTANENGAGELQVLLPEGVHRVEVVRPGYGGFSQDITVSRNGNNRISIRLEKK